MMDSGRDSSELEESSCVPPGFRFHPTDEELVGYYLKNKVAAQKIDLDVIRDIDLYRIEPWDLQDRCRIGYEEQNEWYFFSHKDKKYPTGTRTNRATLVGFWKATGRDKAVYDRRTKLLIGMRKTLVFYKGRAPNGQKTDWIMHEYRLESDENGPPQEEGWVVCRAFKKRPPTAAQSNNNNKANFERWESPTSNNYLLYDQEPISGIIIGHSSAVNKDPNDHDHHHDHGNINNNNLYHLPKHSPPTILSSVTEIASSSLVNCKREELTDLSRPSSNNKTNSASDSCFNVFLTHSDIDRHFLELPQLESPSQRLHHPSLLTRPTTTICSSIPAGSSSSDHNQRNYKTNVNGVHNKEHHRRHQIENKENGSTGSRNHTDHRVTTDWRELDKFVASQLSHDNPQPEPDHDHQHDHEIIATNINYSDSVDEMGLLLMRSNGREEVLEREGEDGEDELDERKQEGGDKLIDGFLTATDTQSDFEICIFDTI